MERLPIVIAPLLTTTMTDHNTTRERSLLAYVADLELEVDRLRKQAAYLQLTTNDAAKKVLSLCDGARDTTAQTLPSIRESMVELTAVMNDLRPPRGIHPSRDQVTLFPVRPLLEQVFRWQQRVLGFPSAELEVECEIDNLEWFPSRFRHILDNLIANALMSYAREADRKVVSVVVRETETRYELEVCDDGHVVLNSGRSVSLELYHRTSPERSAALGVGLAVVETLVDACGGRCLITSKDGCSNVVTVQLPRFEHADYLS